jgi:hypothetical protein
MLSKVTIGVTTFLRPGYLTACLDRARTQLPESPVVVACDDETTPCACDVGAQWIGLPFDSGLTKKRNAIAKAAWTEYTLMIADDYRLQRYGVLRMAEVLEAHPEVDVVVGTYNGKKYEARLEVLPNCINEHQLDLAKETPLFTEPHLAYKVDLGVNYFLARTNVLREVPWDESIGPIGGEHADWFLDLKDAGKLVVFVPGCYVTTFPWNLTWQDPMYLKYRCRAMIGHRKFLAKRHVDYYNVINWRKE